MLTAVAKPKITPAQVIEDMTRLTARQLGTVIEKAALIRLKKTTRVLSERESELLRVINHGLSVEKSAKLEALRHKLSQEAITRREREQLLRLTDELERLGAERLKALMELAAIRKTTVTKLMNEIGMTEAAYA